MSVLVSTHYMDEAERCHAIAFIAYGELLARGSIQEIIEQSHLRTWTVSGPELPALEERLRSVPGSDMVAPFGASLHISGRDAAALDAAIAPFRSDPRLTWTLSQPSLEDVFIAMMANAPDNFR
jgi:ABC-2 type transport system ATP-binding protein